MLIGASIFASKISKLEAFELNDIPNKLTEPQGQRAIRKAKFIDKNCIIHQQAALIKAKKKTNIEECNACVTACPVKAISTNEIKGAKGQMLPSLNLDKCIGCSRCYRVCPQEPKAWEIWDTTNNKKLM